MDWSKGLSARYYMSIVDKDTWRDVRRIEITGGTIKRSLSNLRESADINCINYSEPGEQYVRVWLDAIQEGGSSHTPLFTGIATSPGKNINGKLVSNTLQCYSILKIAQDVLLPRGWYAPADAKGTDLIKDLLDVIGAPITIPNNELYLTYAIIAEDNESNLSMAEKILQAINWRMMINGNGEISLGAYSKESIITFDSLNNDVIEPSLSVEFDWYNCPNVFRAVNGDESAEARDDDPDSPLSTVSRRREVWASESSCYLNNEETLGEYALRRLTELQQVSTTVSYSRRFEPSVYPADIVKLNYPAQNIVGDFIVTSQTIDIGYGSKTQEEVMKI